MRFDRFLNVFIFGYSMVVNICKRGYCFFHNSVVLRPVYPLLDCFYVCMMSDVCVHVCSFPCLSECQSFMMVFDWGEVSGKE